MARYWTNKKSATAFCTALPARHFCLWAHSRLRCSGDGSALTAEHGGSQVPIKFHFVRYAVAIPHTQNVGCKNASMEWTRTAQWHSRRSMRESCHNCDVAVEFVPHKHLWGAWTWQAYESIASEKPQHPATEQYSSTVSATQPSHRYVRPNGWHLQNKRKPWD